MRRILLLVRKDLLRQWRSPLSMLLVLAFPLIFASLLALTFGGGGAPQLPKVRLLIEDRDGTFISKHIVDALSAEHMSHLDVQLVGPEGAEIMERGDASALLVIPDRFGESLMAGQSVALELVRNPAEGILPDIAEQTLASVTGMTSYFTATRGAAQQPPDLITLEAVQLEEPDGRPAGATRGLIFLIVLPGISVWALFMLGDMAMRDIVTESTQGTLRRQLVAPLAAPSLVVGKASYTAVLSLISLLLLSLIGWLATGRTVDLPGFTVLSLCLVLAVTGVASLIYGLARTQNQGSTIGAILFLVFAFMGGAFIQVESLPPAVRRFSPLSPFYWGTTGYGELIRDEGGLLDVLPNAGVLAAIGIVGLAIGSSFLQRRVLRGGAA